MGHMTVVCSSSRITKNRLSIAVRTITTHLTVSDFIIVRGGCLFEHLSELYSIFAHSAFVCTDTSLAVSHLHLRYKMYGENHVT